MKRKRAQAANAALVFSGGKSALTGNACIAFTLIELLVVVAIIVVMTTLAIPAFNAIRGGTDFTSEVYEIAGLFDQARAYATANNTYVLAGIDEVSSAQDTSANPQVSGTGRVAVALFASKSGMRPYQAFIVPPYSWLQWRSSVYGAGAAFIPVTNLMAFQNIHLVDLQFNGASQLSIPTSGPMARPPLTSYYCDLSNTTTAANSGPSSTWFAWPQGTKLNGTPAPQYTFKAVVEFDPEGSARIIYQNNSISYPDAIAPYLEIGLQPSKGGVVAGPPQNQATNPGQIAAIQINGITGAVHTYRP